MSPDDIMKTDWYCAGTLDLSVLYSIPRTAMDRDPREWSPRIEVVKWLFPHSAARLSKKLQLYDVPVTMFAAYM